MRQARGGEGESLNLSDLKHSSRLLLAVLGRERAGQHLRCAFHDEERGSMAVWEDTDGTWLWKCHSSCGGGTIIDAAMKKWNCADTRSAIAALEKELGVKLSRDVEAVETRINLDRAERFIEAAHKALMEDFALQEELLLGKRGIKSLDMVRHYRLGFVRDARFPEWFKWRVTGWVLPVTNKGVLAGVKIHTQGMDRSTPDQRKIPKCLWAPFGTSPGPGKPKHAALTLWPEPERWKKPAALWLCPGELKALALVDKGFPATSSTAGEGSKFAPFMLERIKACEPRSVVLNHDDDKAGREWLDHVAPMMLKAGIETLAISGRELCRRAKELAAAPPAPPPPEPKPNSPEDLGYGQPDDWDMADADWAVAMDDAAVDTTTP